MTRSKTLQVGLVLVLVSLVLLVIAACGAAPATPQVVVETVVVEKEVVKEVVQTVEVAAAADCPTKKDNYKIGFAN